MGGIISLLAFWLGGAASVPPSVMPDFVIGSVDSELVPLRTISTEGPRRTIDPLM
jgi:hypothetical protein